MSEKQVASIKQPVALITGATGFVGRHVVRKLINDGWKVHIISRAKSELPIFVEFSQVINHVHDGSSEGMIACVFRAKPDVVFHLASLFLAQHTVEDVELLIRSNILFGNQLLEAMRVNNVKYIINTSTSWQHYENADYNPVCLYAATKQAFESIMEYYVQACEIKAITLKLFDTYGPDDDRPKLFNLLSKAAMSGATLDMSPGEQLIDLIYIDDVSNAYVIAAQRLLDAKVGQHEYYAVSSGNSLPLKDLVQIYIEVTKKNVSVNWGARPYRYREVMDTWNNGKALAGWAPRVSIKSGILSLTRSTY